MTIKARIAAATEDVRQRGGRLAEGGAIGQAVMRHGVCKAISQHLGLRIIWRNARFHVT
jgi:hypothetical protein